MSNSAEMGNPMGGVCGRRAPVQPASSDDVLARVVDPVNLKKAWRQVRANDGAPGVDGMSIAEFPGFVREHWSDIRAALLNGTYRPSPVRRAMIPKAFGRGVRPLGIPTVVDRVILQAIQQVLTPMFDDDFSSSSFGYRPGRSAHGAVRQVQSFARGGFVIAVDLDVEAFFDHVDFDLLMLRLRRRVTDRRLLRLIGQYLRAGVSIDGQVCPTRQGIAQGSPLSPLLANIYLDDLDRELERRGHRFARYADDVMILVASQRAGERVMASLGRWLWRHLKLRVNADKSRVAPLAECPFLGFCFQGSKLCWSEKTMQRFRYRIKRLTRRSWGVSMKRRFRELEEYLRGWMAYFWIADYYRPIPEIEAWIRRRIRMCHWQQWRRPRRRIQQLLRLGVGKDHAISTGCSSDGPWHLSRTLATQLAMSNTWLAQQGLVSFRDLWIARAHPR